MLNEPLLLLKAFSVISLFNFLMFGFDKYLAMQNARRIKERTLLAVSALGGWPGGVIGMVVFRHKISKGHFKAAMAISVTVNLIIVYLVFWHQ